MSAEQERRDGAVFRSATHRESVSRSQQTQKGFVLSTEKNYMELPAAAAYIIKPTMRVVVTQLDSVARSVMSVLDLTLLYNSWSSQLHDLVGIARNFF